jgi:hypothetical protein
MKCSGSQTICTAPEPQTRVVGVFEALLFEQVLEPLAKPLGPLGEVAIASAVERLFVPPHSKSP